MAIKWKNFAEARIATPPAGTSGLTFAVEAGKGLRFPTLASGEYFYGIITNASYSVFEVVKVVARTDDSFTIEAAGRGLDATGAQVWSANDLFYYGLTESALSEIFNFATDPELVALASVTSAADKLFYFNGPGSASLVDVTTYGLSLLNSANAAGARELLSASQAGQLDAPTGTRMVFHQTSAPTGWTKETDAAYNDIALRVVTGTVGNGGTNAFSDVFNTAITTDGHTLTSAEMPSHEHTGSFSGSTSEDGAHSHTVPNMVGATTDDASGSARTSDGPIYKRATVTTSAEGAHTHSVSGSLTTNSTGGGGSHTHPITMDVKYHDVILAVKD